MWHKEATSSSHRGPLVGRRCVRGRPACSVCTASRRRRRKSAGSVGTRPVGPQLAAGAAWGVRIKITAMISSQPQQTAYPTKLVRLAGSSMGTTTPVAINAAAANPHHSEPAGQDLGVREPP